MIATQTCDRCHKPTVATTMSMFNTQTICLDCWKAERQHPRFTEARNAEEAACRQGNYNFPGIGWTPPPKGGPCQ